MFSAHNVLLQGRCELTSCRLQARSVAARAAALDQEVLEGEGGLLEGQGRLVQWYPGHIARAERRLQEQLSQVDAVLEVRDARWVFQALCASMGS